MTLSPVFYDIEASGLHGVPIEIGWAFADTETGGIHVTALLIQPPAEWDITSLWDDAAQSLHGISLDSLYVNGHAPHDVIRRMNAALGDQEIVSDAPAWDLNWMQMVADAASTVPSFTVSRKNGYSIIGAMAQGKGWGAGECRTKMEEVAARAPRTHRAADDARHLAELWLAMMRGP